MHLTTLLPLTLTLAPLATAVGNAIVHNNCPSDIYLWSVGGSVGPKQTIPQGSKYTEAFHHDPSSGGISLKITTTENGLYDGSPQLTYAYTLDGNNVWYDISDVFGDPFSGKTVVIKPVDSGCGSVCWPKGVSTGGSQVRTCGAGGDVVLEVCAESC